VRREERRRRANAERESGPAQGQCRQFARSPRLELTDAVLPLLQAASLQQRVLQLEAALRDKDAELATFREALQDAAPDVQVSRTLSQELCHPASYTPPLCLAVLWAAGLPTGEGPWPGQGSGLPTAGGCCVDNKPGR
jgi:hypothetical protein